MDLTALAASVAVSVGTVVAGFLVARRFQKLGGGEAQERLNAIRKELDDAMSDKVRVLEEQFTACKTRLTEVERSLADGRDERRDLKQEISDLHNEVRTLQLASRDRAQDGRTLRQNERDVHQDARDK